MATFEFAFLLFGPLLGFTPGKVLGAVIGCNLALAGSVIAILGVRPEFGIVLPEL